MLTTTDLTSKVAGIWCVAARHPFRAALLLLYGVFVAACTILGGGDGLSFAILSPLMVLLCVTFIGAFPLWAGNFGESPFVIALGVELVFGGVGAFVLFRKSKRVRHWLIAVALLFALNLCLNIIFPGWIALTE